MTEPQPLRVLVVDDHALFREGLVGILSSQPDMQIAGQASDGLEAIVMARDLRPDIVLMDVAMPGTDGIEATRAIKQELPEVRVIMLTVREESDRLFEAIKAGADGYLIKTIRAQQLVDLLRAAQRGEAAITPKLAAQMMEEFRRLARLAPAASAEAEDKVLNPLTAREREVLGLIAKGASDRDIAQELTVSLYTVKSHVRALLQKLQVASRYEAAQLARHDKRN